MKQAWAGEVGGLAALQAVWNVDKPALAAGHRPYQGRAGFDWDAVWSKLSQVRVQRRVDRQGKLSLWDHAVRVGQVAANQCVTVTFDAAREQVVVRDEHEVVLAALALPWLTEDWLWAPVPLPDQGVHGSGTSTRP
jgi:hypothetical protein